MGRIAVRNFKPWDNYLIVFGKPLGERGRRQKSLPATSEKNKKENQKSKQGRLTVGKSVTLLSFPTFLHKTTCRISTLSWSEESFGACVINRVVRGISGLRLHISHCIIISWAMLPC